MSWVKIDDGAPEHPKLIDLSDAGMALWIRALCYCARRRNDGLVPAGALRILSRAKSPAKVADELVKAKLWDVCDAGGYMVCSIRDAWAFANDDTWSRAHYPAVYVRDGNACRYCGSSEVPTVDHVIPRCQGGSDELHNLVVACRGCNSKKSGRTPEQAGMTLQMTPVAEVS